MSHPQTAPRLAPTLCQEGWLSLIIPICGGLDLSRACFTSILQARARTGLPHELIFVDNNSEDGSAEWLEGLQARFEWVRVSSQSRNEGFAGGCNAGFRTARGEYLAILNNDTLVEHQLFAKLLHALQQGRGIGLLAPVSNYVMGQQLVKLQPDEGTEDIERIAERLGLEAEGKISEVDRLAGLCLLGRRSFFETVGLFDPAYGLGNYEDQDICLRARIADYRLFVVHDAYVHHLGSQTFQELGIDYWQQLEQQKQLHLARWKDNLLFLLEEAWEAKDYDRVLTLSDSPSPETPGMAWILRIRAKALLEQHREADALPLLEEFARCSPLHTETAYLLAFCLLEIGRVRQGRLQLARTLRECYMDDTLGALVLTRLARWCWSRSLPREARQHLAASHEILPGFTPTKIIESGFLLEEGQHEEVLALLSPLRNENDTDIFANLGIAHFHLGNIDQALADFEEGARLGGPDSAAAQNLTQLQPDGMASR